MQNEFVVSRARYVIRSPSCTGKVLRARQRCIYVGVSPKYSSESAGKARMHTCLDQYRANKSNGGNGGLKWIEKGGGYHGVCNKRLKAEA